MASTTVHPPSSESPKCLAAAPAHPFRMAVYSAVALVAGVMVAVALERSRYEVLGGYYQAGISVVTAGRDARIARVLVQPGMQVKLGQPLVLLEDDQLQRQMLRLRSDVQTLQAELEQTEAQYLVELEWRKKALQTEILDLKLRSAQYLKQQFSDQVESIAWEEALQNLEGTASLDTAVAVELQRSLGDEPTREERRIRAMLRQEAAINAREVSTVQLELCNERVKQLEGLEAQLPERIRRTMGLDLIRAKLSDAEAELLRLEGERRLLTLTARTPGVVGVFQKRAGEHVRADDPIVQLLDSDVPYVVLQVPSTRLADFATGQEVELRFPGGEVGQGKIDRVAPQTSPVPVGNCLLSDSLLAATIVPQGKTWPQSIPVGTSVQIRRRR